MCLGVHFTVKLIYFLWFGALAMLLPYLNIHMKKLGVSSWDASIVCSVVSLLQLFTCPLASKLMSQTSSFKRLVLWSYFLTSTSALVILLAPEIPRPKETHISMHFECGPTITPGIITDKCNNKCDQIPSEIEAYFSECHVDCPNRHGIFKNIADLCFDDQHGRVCHVVEVNNTLSDIFTFGIYLSKPSEYKANQCLYHIEAVTWHQQFFHHVSCPIILKDESETRCALTCDMQEIQNSDIDIMLSGERECLSLSSAAIRAAFWIYFGLRILFHLFLGITCMFVDHSLNYVIKVKGKRQHVFTVWSLLSSAVFTPLAGWYLDKYTSLNSYIGYVFVFSSFFILAVVSLMYTSSLQLEGTHHSQFAENILLFFKLLKRLDVVFFLVIVFVIGMINGFFDNFLFWYMEDISASYLIMGLTAIFGAVVGLPFIAFPLPKLNKLLEPGYLLIICLLCQCLRCVGYYFSNNYWWSMLLESLGSFAFYWLWMAVAMYRNRFIHREQRLPFQVCAGIIHYALGKSCGALSMGLLMSIYNFQSSVFLLALLSGVLVVLYLIIYSILKKTCTHLNKNGREDMTNVKTQSLLDPELPQKMETEDSGSWKNSETSHTEISVDTMEEECSSL